VVFLSFYIKRFIKDLERMFVTHFQHAATMRVGKDNVLDIANTIWMEVLYLIIPLFLVSASIAVLITFFQTRMNWSWKKLKPDFSRLNPLKGIARMVNFQALFELAKGIGKMAVVSIAAYLILKSEWKVVPGLMIMPITTTWGHWAEITGLLFWSVSGLMLFVAAADYTYNFFQMERQMKMTKQEVKEEHKKREVDPHVKGKLRRMARDFAMGQMLEDTKSATVVVTNPTHFAVALRYEVGMAAPIVVAKGVDHLAKEIREVAKAHDVPIIENKPLARTLYKLVEIGQAIPDSLYRAVSEVIRYIFKLKGVRVGSQTS
jgi:flagellar biosynthesis protein FlhB